MDPSQAAQIKPYAPWLIIAGVFVLLEAGVCLSGSG